MPANVDSYVGPRPSASPGSSGQTQAPLHPTVVVALGGHAFISPGERGTHAQSLANARAICRELMKLVERGYDLVITHGNGPQVGDLLRRVELCRHGFGFVHLLRQCRFRQLDHACANLGHLAGLSLNDEKAVGVRKEDQTQVVAISNGKVVP